MKREMAKQEEDNVIIFLQPLPEELWVIILSLRLGKKSMEKRRHYLKLMIVSSVSAQFKRIVEKEIMQRITRLFPMDRRILEGKRFSSLTTLNLCTPIGCVENLIKDLPISSLTLGGYCPISSDFLVNELTLLRSLGLHNCQDIIASVVYLLTRLDTLRLIGADVSEHRSISTLTNLTSLTTSNVKLRGKHISSLYSLTSLTLGGWHSVSGEDIRRLTNLRKLKISQCQGLNDNAIKDLTSLRTLHLSFITSLTTNGITHLTNLTKLWFESANNGRLPPFTDDSVGHLQALRTLHMSDNTNITATCIRRLPNLTRLEVDNRYCVSRAFGKELEEKGVNVKFFF